MSFLTVVYASLFYIAAVVLVAGLTAKIVQYARTPAPLKIPTTPAPTTESGVVLRLVREVVLFESLFKGNKWIWIFGWVFHFGLFLVTLRHLRYFIDPVWLPVELVQPFGIYGGMAMVAGLSVYGRDAYWSIACAISPGRRTI
jgi:nitrate reductase gamma subunit